MKRIVNKTVNLDCSEYKNYELLGAFIQQAHRESWSEEEIDMVVKAAIEDKGNYFTTIISLHCKHIES
ncbi:MAG: hypothetical protein AAF611_07855 [Bacteroidota bacterium]